MRRECRGSIAVWVSGRMRTLPPQDTPSCSCTGQHPASNNNGCGDTHLTVCALQETASHKVRLMTQRSPSMDLPKVATVTIEDRLRFRTRRAPLNMSEKIDTHGIGVYTTLFGVCLSCADSFRSTSPHITGEVHHRYHACRADQTCILL